MTDNQTQAIIKIIDHVKDNYSEFQRNLLEQDDDWQKKVLKYRFQLQIQEIIDTLEIGEAQTVKEMIESALENKVNKVCKS